MELRREDIYDALLDDEALAELPHKLASAFEARSCVLHWFHGESLDETIAMNGYFTAEQMADYAENFAADDLWSLRALEPHRANRAFNAEEFVPAEEFERSVLYNEWIRAMGDDTFHCLGMAVKTEWGAGCIGLHRGRSQGSFAPEAKRQLEENVGDLRRMLEMRGRLTAAHRQSDELAQTLDLLAAATLTVAADGTLLHANSSARALLDQNDGLFLIRGKVRAANGSMCNLRSLLALAANPAGGQSGAMLVPRREGRPLALTAAPLRTKDGRRCVLLAVEPSERAEASLLGQLRQVYGLSPAEAEIAAHLAEGRSPQEIADERRVALGTIRHQVKRIAEKMDCRRQLEIVRMVNRLPSLRLPELQH